MSFKASGTLRSILTLCLALSATILPAHSAPAPIGNTSPWIPRSLKSLFEPRAAANQCGSTGTGVYITNKGSGSQTFTVFEGYLTYHSSVTLAKDASTPVTLPTGFVGHVQRGSGLPSTWVELNMVAGAADGDVSLEIGCDGGATVQASAVAGGGEGQVFGFSKDIISDAPAGALYNPASNEELGGPKTTFAKVLDETGTIATGVKNAVTLAYEKDKLSQSDEYLWGGSGTNQAIASNNCILIDFY